MKFMRDGVGDSSQDRKNENEDEGVAWMCRRCGVKGVVTIKGNDDIAIALHVIDLEHLALSPMCMNPIRRFL